MQSSEIDILNLSDELERRILYLFQIEKYADKTINSNFEHVPMIE